MMHFFPISLLVLFFFNVNAQKRSISVAWVRTVSSVQFRHGAFIEPKQSTGIQFSFKENVLPWLALGGEISYFRFGTGDGASQNIGTINGNQMRSFLKTYHRANVLAIEGHLLVSYRFHKIGLPAVRIGIQPSFGLASVGFSQTVVGEYWHDHGSFIGSTDYYYYRNTIVPIAGVQFPFALQINDKLDFLLSLKFQKGFSHMDDFVLTHKAENPLSAFPSLWAFSLNDERERLGKMSIFHAFSLLVGVQYRFEK